MLQYQSYTIYITIHHIRIQNTVYTKLHCTTLCYTTPYTLHYTLQTFLSSLLLSPLNGAATRFISKSCWHTISTLWGSLTKMMALTTPIYTYKVHKIQL